MLYIIRMILKVPSNVFTTSTGFETIDYRPSSLVASFVNHFPATTFVFSKFAKGSIEEHEIEVPVTRPKEASCNRSLGRLWNDEIVSKHGYVVEPTLNQAFGIILIVGS
jgi:hypothetical protein